MNEISNAIDISSAPVASNFDSDVNHINAVPATEFSPAAETVTTTPVPVTVRFADEVEFPLYAAALAEMLVVPAPNAVARPVIALTLATAGAEDAQVTPVVTTAVEGWLPLPYVPTATNCAV